MSSRPSEAWTDERLARFAEMKDLRQRDILEELNRMPGPKLSRNAVIGRYRRIFGSKKPKRVLTDAEKIAARCRANERKREKRADEKKTRFGVGAQVQAINRVKEADGPPVKPEAFTPRTADVGSLSKTIVEVGFKTECHWPDDERNSDGEFTFCGHPVTAGSFYCKSHHAISCGKRIAITEADRARRKAHAAKVWFGASVKLVGNPAEVA